MKKIRIHMEVDIEIEDKPDSLLGFTIDTIQNLRADVKGLIEKAAKHNTDSPIKVSVNWTGGTPKSLPTINLGEIRTPLTKDGDTYYQAWEKAYSK